MKKVLFLLMIFCCFMINVKALEETSNLIKVELVKCEDALTSWVYIDGEKRIIHLIATDMSDGNLNDTINSYVCNKLNNAKTIEIEYDPKYLNVDEFNRLNVWVYIDGKLLQSDLIEKGYAQVNYINDDYLYLNDLCSLQKNALEQRLGIWNYPNEKEKYCQSGINLDNTSSNVVEEQKEETKKDNRYLYDMLGITILMIILSFMIRFKRSKNG